MSGIYIPNMEMPKDEEIILVYPDGNAALFARMDIDVLDFALKDSKAIPVPDHGDLIDRDTALDSLMNGMVMTGNQSRAMDCLNEIYVPTIIPADGKDGAE